MKNLVLILAFLPLFGIAQSKFGDDSDGVKKAKGSKKYDLNVVYVNGDERELKTTFDINFCTKTMFLEDKEKGVAIYPAETQFVERKLKDGSVIQGFPKDSMWAFNVVKGDLKGISSLPNTSMRSIEYLEYKDNGIVDFNKENLRRLIEGNELALRSFETAESREKTSKLLVYVGSPILLLGLMTGDLSYYFYGAGSAIVGTGVAFKVMSNHKYRDTIKKYNE